VDDTTGPAGPAPPATIYGGAFGELDQIDRARGLTREQRVLVGVQNPITCSTPVRFYQERSNSLTSPHLTEAQNHPLWVMAAPAGVPNDPARMPDGSPDGGRGPRGQV
jgi:hypothetical protein